MGYPERLLSEGEVIASQFRPHWSGIIREGTLLVLTLVLMVLVTTQGGSGWIILALGVAAVGVVARGLIRWWTTLHVVTNERVIYRAGLISKRGKEIPLEVVNDVAFSQTVMERLFGTGDLLIESAGTHGQSRYQDIPSPEEVQSLIYEMREVRLSGTNQKGTMSESVASQLETLSKLHDAGKLTDTEFEAQKRRLLG